MLNTQILKNDVIYLQFFDDTYLALTLLFHLILTLMSWLQPRKGDLYFILSDNGNYDLMLRLDIVECGFVNDVIDYGCLRCVFCFRIKDKEKDIFYINFYFIIFLQSFFFFNNFSLLQLNNYNRYLCVIYN